MQPSEQERDFTDSYRFVSPLFFVAIGFGMGVLATILAMSRNFLSRDFLDDFAPEALGIVITVGVIGWFNHRITRNQYKKNLIRQMGSPSNDFALEAVRQLRHEGWLSDGSLRGADLSRANLRKVGLKFADLQHADFSRSNLEKGTLTGANLQGATFRHADLQEASLIKAYLQTADLRHAEMGLADLEEANLYSTNLERAKLQEACLRRAILINSKLQNSELQNADLNNAQLQNADLNFANLQNAKLKNANLQNANLYYVKFQGAILMGINLQNAKSLSMAEFDENTILPDSDTSQFIVGCKRWTPDTDMTRYTDPNHPDFWQPEWVKKLQKT